MKPIEDVRRAFGRGLCVLAATAGLAACSVLAEDVEYLGSFVWPRTSHGGGGFSALELDANGQAFVTISDRARQTTGTLIRSGGRLTGIDAAPLRPLTDPSGHPLPIEAADSEGLALLPDGRTCISFEGNHRVWCYDRDGTARATPPLPDVFDGYTNRGIETLAADAEGRLYAIPEHSGGLTTPFPVMRLDNDAWTQPFALPRRGGHLPVGADFGPDGRLYVLERLFTGYGFSSRVRRFDVSDNGLTNETILIDTPALRHDNLEGLAVWQDASGATRLTMISDDNEFALQRTEIVEYRVTRP